jgi:hypothetical protein
MSVPSASGSIRQASATAAPPLLPPHRIEGLGASAEFGRIRLPDRDRAGAPQARDEGRIGRRHVVVEDRRPKRRADAGRWLQILVGNRQPVQRPRRPAARETLVSGAGRGHRLVRCDRHDRVDGGIDRFDARQRRADDVARRQRAGANQPRQLDRRETANVHEVRRHPPASVVFPEWP